MRNLEGLQFSHRVGIGKIVIVIIVIAIIAVSALAVDLYESSQTPANNVTFSLGISPGPEDAPQYYAQQQGYYSKQGINVTILPGTGGAAAIAAVSTGQVEFALTDASSMAYSLITSNVTNVRIVAVLFPNSFFGVIYNKADVSSLKDLVGTPGAAVGVATSTATKLFLALMQKNNLSTPTNVQYGTSQTVIEPYVATGKVDWVIGGSQDVATLQPAASKVGIQLGFLSFDQYGLNSYGEVLIASTSMISTHTDLVRRFVLATMQGMVQADLNPTAAADAENQAQPQLNATSMLVGWNLDISCCLQGITSSTNPLVFGYINPQRMQQTVNTVLAGAGVTKSVNATQFYDDEFTQAS